MDNSMTCGEGMHPSPSVWSHFELHPGGSEWVDESSSWLGLVNVFTGVANRRLCTTNNSTHKERVVRLGRFIRFLAGGFFCECKNICISLKFYCHWDFSMNIKIFMIFFMKKANTWTNIYKSFCAYVLRS